MSNPAILAFRAAGAAICDNVKSMFMNGDCDHIHADDLSKWLDMCSPIKYVTTEEAICHTKYSRQKFFDCRLADLIHEPIKVPNYFHAVYSKRKLDEDIKFIESLDPKELRRTILIAKSKRNRRKFDD